MNSILKNIGNIIINNDMVRTLREDKSIIANIDKFDENDMEGYFDFEFDKLSRHYKIMYKKYVEYNE